MQMLGHDSTTTKHSLIIKIIKNEQETTQPAMVW